jgi:hypothetical protein
VSYQQSAVSHQLPKYPDISEMYSGRELDREATDAKYATVQTEGKLFTLQQAQNEQVVISSVLNTRYCLLNIRIS